MVVQLCKSVRIKGSKRVGFVSFFLSRLYGGIKSKELPRFTVSSFPFYFPEFTGTVFK